MTLALITPRDFAITGEVAAILAAVWIARLARKVFIEIQARDRRARPVAVPVTPKRPVT